MEENDRLQRLLRTLVCHLVDSPDAVEVRASALSRSSLYELKVAPEDVGRVIGRQGRVIRALRVVLRSVAAPSGKRVELQLLE